VGIEVVTDLRVVVEGGCECPGDDPIRHV
jgi:hypothetical protein